MEPILETEDSDNLILGLSEEAIIDKTNVLLKLCSNIQTSLDEKSQQLYDYKNELSRLCALDDEYIHEIEVLQTENQNDGANLKLKIQKIEDELNDLNDQHAQRIEDLELSIFKKNEEICKLHDEIHLIENASMNSYRSEVDELNLRNADFKNALEELENEITILKDNISFLEKWHVIDVEHGSTLKEELNQLNESYKYKKEELREVKQLNEALQEELILVQQELKTVQNNPLQNKNQTSSLFAEVNDKRLELQERIALLKSQYLERKSEHSKLLAKVAYFNSTNAMLSERWENESQARINDNDIVNEAYSERIKLLETQQKASARIISICQKVASITLKNVEEIQFLENLLEAKNKEIQQAKEQGNSFFLSKTMLSRQLRNSKMDMNNWETKVSKSELLIDKLVNQRIKMQEKLTNPMTSLKDMNSTEINSSFQKLNDCDLKVNGVSNQLEQRVCASVSECNKENTEIKQQTYSFNNVPKKVGFTVDVKHTDGNGNKLRKGCKIIHCKPTVLKKKS